jgi:parallel beta-helix repeat protein
VLRGRGPLATTLDFTGQQTGAQGILAVANGFVVQDLRVLNPKGDGVRVESADGVIFQGVHVEWNTEPETGHGAYGIYPVACKNVLVDNSQVRGSSDAGIYVGQSEGVIVRRSRAFENVAGIEIENTKDADVYLNYMSDNTAGLLIFDLPGNPFSGCRAHTDPAKNQPDCRGTRAFSNWIIGNNHVNFASGGTVALVPPGTGVLVMATDNVEINSNVVHDHKTVSLVVVNYGITQLPIRDPNYNPYTERVEIWDNEFVDGGYDPEGDLGVIIGQVFYPDPLPDVTIENIYLDPTLREADGTLPSEVEICVGENHDGNGGPATAGTAKAIGGSRYEMLSNQCTHPRRTDTVLAPFSDPPIVEDPYTPEEIAAACQAGTPPGAGVNWGAADFDCPTLADYRLFQDPTDPRAASNAGGTPFDLTTPLFSDYAQKDRFVFVPPGQAATYDADNVFQFPVGTIIVKTFSFGHDLRAPEIAGSDVVETRLLIRRASGWIGRAYIHNAAGTEAFLALGGGAKDVEWIAGDGNLRQTTYQIPSAFQCSRCHRGPNGDEPIGPKARLLNRDFDYDGLVENQLDYWSDIGILAGAPVDPGTVPRLPIWSDPSDGTLDQRARAYLESNCAHCHTSQAGAAARFTGLYLEASRALGSQVGVCKKPGSAGPGAGGLAFDIVPGQPEMSIMIFRMASTAPQIKMPELSKSVVHDEGTQVVADWIASLGGSCAP